MEQNAGTVEIRITAVKDQARAGLIATQKLADAAVSHGSTASRDYSVSTPQIISPRELAMVGEKSPVQEKPLRASAAADATPPAPAPRDLAAPRESAVAPKVAATPTSSAATHDLATPRSAAAPAETAAPREANALRDAATPQAGGQGVFKASHSGKGKWILLGVLAGGGAAAGMALGRSHAASSATTPPAGLSIGTPSITVGAHP